MSRTGGPRLPDIQTQIQAGINPKTGLPLRCDSGVNLFESTRIFMRLIDEQDAVNRYVWYNLPDGITGQELERMLYYKGQLCFFYFKELDKFYFMPYALDGTIDFYGRFNSVHPVPFTSGSDDDKNKGKFDVQEGLLKLLKRKCIYGPIIYDDDEENIVKHMEEDCVLLHDYTKQLSQTILPRKDVNEAIIHTEAEIIAFLRTRLIIATGVEGMRVSDADASDQVTIAAQSLYKAALEGKPFTSLISSIEFQELMNKSGLDAQSFTLALQSIDNLRLSSYGLNNGGLFEKKAHELGQEAEMNEINTSIILNDGLKIRQNFCNIVNSIWGLGVWCEPSESLTGVDVNGDGTSYDSDSEGSQSSPEGGEGGNDNE